MLPRRHLLAACGLALSRAALAGDWPQWRGPAGTGVSAEPGLPIAWSEERGLLWKCKLPAWGTSTPAIWKDAIFVTSHTDDDKLLLVKIHKATGEIAWTREVGQGEAPREAEKRTTQKFHQLHNLASPSPVTDGERVVVHFGNGLLAAYDYSGEQLWRRNLAEQYGDYSIWWGHANSPVLYKNLVISACLQDSLADVRDKPVESYLIAHDVRDGVVKWKLPRATGAKAEEGDAYTTPLLLKVGERMQLITMGGNVLDGRDPQSGQELWRLPGLVGGRTVTSPTASHGLIFCTRGEKGPLVAVKPEKPIVLERHDIEWSEDQGTPDTCSPVAWDTLLFTVTDDGIVRCYDLLTGRLRWKERLKGQYKASPMAAESRIFFLNTTGLCTVVAASPKFDKLTENQLDDDTLASPATSDGRLYIRGRQSLYCLGSVIPAAEEE